MRTFCATPRLDLHELDVYLSAFQQRANSLVSSNEAQIYFCNSGQLRIDKYMGFRSKGRLCQNLRRLLSESSKIREAS